jgi:hypothetical protein
MMQEWWWQLTMEEIIEIIDHISHSSIHNPVVHSVRGVRMIRRVITHIVSLWISWPSNATTPTQCVKGKLN